MCSAKPRKWYIRPPPNMHPPMNLGSSGMIPPSALLGRWFRRHSCLPETKVGRPFRSSLALSHAPGCREQTSASSRMCGRSATAVEICGRQTSRRRRICLHVGATRGQSSSISASIHRSGNGTRLAGSLRIPEFFNCTSSTRAVRFRSVVRKRRCFVAVRSRRQGSSTYLQEYLS